MLFNSLAERALITLNELKTNLSVILPINSHTNYKKENCLEKEKRKRNLLNRPLTMD